MIDGLLRVLFCFLHDACHIRVDDSKSAALSAGVGSGDLLFVVLLVWVEVGLPSFL